MCFYSIVYSDAWFCLNEDNETGFPTQLDFYLDSSDPSFTRYIFPYLQNNEHVMFKHAVLQHVSTEHRFPPIDQNKIKHLTETGSFRNKRQKQDVGCI